MTFPPSGLLLSRVPAPTDCGALQLSSQTHHERLKLERQQVVETNPGLLSRFTRQDIAAISPRHHQDIANAGAGSYRLRARRLRLLAAPSELGACRELGLGANLGLAGVR
jgi:hypothetical protein